MSEISEDWIDIKDSVEQKIKKQMHLGYINCCIFSKYNHVWKRAQRSVYTGAPRQL